MIPLKTTDFFMMFSGGIKWNIEKKYVKYQDINIAFDTLITDLGPPLTQNLWMLMCLLTNPFQSSVAFHIETNRVLRFI